jgi:hypothetical protein
METLLQIVQDVCDEIGLQRPAYVVNSTDQQVTQLLALANATGRDLVRMHPWQVLDKQYAFTTSNGVDTYSLPSDFNRLTNQTEWDRTNHWPLMGPKSAQEWAFLKGGIISTGPRIRFRVMNNQLNLFPVPSSALNMNLEYNSKNWVTSSDGSYDKFMADTDTNVFDDQLMVYGIKYKWMQAKGFDATGAKADYALRLSECMAQDEGAPTLAMARRQTAQLINTWSIPESGYGS